MADEIVHIGESFWNIRGALRIGGLVNVGTQASLVRLRSGEFVMLDSYGYDDETAREVMRLTDDGITLTAILNLHPFHTIHVEAIAKKFPNARLFGTTRHKERSPELGWELLTTDDPKLHAIFAPDLEFSVPQGVEFISANEKVHFSSVLAFHRASGTLHVDDTLSWLDLPLVGGLKFHPTLKQSLLPRAGAADEFQNWAEELADRCDEVTNLCTAHGASLPPNHEFASWGNEVRNALASVEGTLDSHRKKYG